MPYINETRRDYFDGLIINLGNAIDTINEDDSPTLAGDLNYIITSLLDRAYPITKRYRQINEIIGVLECAKMEFYRRVAAPYEDQKKHEDGEVYVLPALQTNY